MDICLEYESPDESGRPAGQVSSVTVWSSSDPGETEIDFLISGEAPGGPETLAASVDHAISALTATRDFLRDVTPAELADAPGGWDDVPATGRLCDCGCGRPMAGRRSDARYASGACRIRAYRAQVTA